MVEQIGPVLSHYVDVYGLIAIFIIMLLKEIGLPIPIPSDLLMLAAAAQAAAGRYILWQGFGIILLAMIVGALVQYMLVRSFGRPMLDRVGRYIGLPPERVDKASALMRKGGTVGIATSLTTPGVRIATVPACALAEVPIPNFLLGVLIGSGIFLALHFAIGYIGGPIISLIMNAGGMAALLVVVALAVIGLVVWLWLRRRGKTKAEAQAATMEGVGDWLDACCPVCLAIGAARGVRESATSASH
ncbi:MAG: VTT domain-containing protein [Anaerolineae bacterium]